MAQPRGLSSSEMEEMDANRKLTVFKHRKKQAANDAQLLMNRIALLQKEEERARKKIEQTKERAMEILVMRSENEKRIQEYVQASDREEQYKRYLNIRNKEADEEMRKQRTSQLENIYFRRRGEVTEMQQERKLLTKNMLKEQEKELKMKQKKAEEIRRREEEARLRKEQERKEQERRIREEFERKAAEEEAEARKAEKLVKALEKKEREWMMKLRETQTMQETAFNQLESALQAEAVGFPISAGMGLSGGGMAVYAGGSIESSEAFGLGSMSGSSAGAGAGKARSPGKPPSGPKMSGRLSGSGMSAGRVVTKVPGVPGAPPRGRIPVGSAGSGSGTGTGSGPRAGSVGSRSRGTSVDPSKKRSSSKSR